MLYAWEMVKVAFKCMLHLYNICSLQHVLLQIYILVLLISGSHSFSNKKTYAIFWIVIIAEVCWPIILRQTPVNADILEKRFLVLQCMLNLHSKMQYSIGATYYIDKKKSFSNPVRQLGNTAYSW